MNDDLVIETVQEKELTLIKTKFVKKNISFRQSRLSLLFEFGAFSLVMVLMFTGISYSVDNFETAKKTDENRIIYY
jgi:hypothetical protein